MGRWAGKCFHNAQQTLIGHPTPHCAQSLTYTSTCLLRSCRRVGKELGGLCSLPTPGLTGSQQVERPARLGTTNRREE